MFLRNLPFLLFSKHWKNGKKKIRSDIENSEKLKEEAQGIKRELEETLKAAHGKAETIVQLAHDEAKKSQEKSLQETEAKVRQIQKDAEQEIQSSRTKLLQEIRSYTAALTIASAEKFLKKAFSYRQKSKFCDFHKGNPGILDKIRV